MEEDRDSLAGIKYFIKHDACLFADENRLDKRNDLQFLIREMFSLILSCLCFVLNIPSCKKSLYKDSNKMVFTVIKPLLWWKQQFSY